MDLEKYKNSIDNLLKGYTRRTLELNKDNVDYLLRKNLEIGKIDEEVYYQLLDYLYEKYRILIDELENKKENKDVKENNDSIEKEENTNIEEDIDKTESEKEEKVENNTDRKEIKTEHKIKVNRESFLKEYQVDDIDFTPIYKGKMGEMPPERKEDLEK